MKIGKIVKIIKRPDSIPVILPRRKTIKRLTGIPAPGWPSKKTIEIKTKGNEHEQ